MGLDGITSVADVASERATLAALSYQAGHIAFGTWDRRLRGEDFDRDAVWAAAKLWADLTGIVSLSGAHPRRDLTDRVAQSAWHQFVQGWCEAADVEDVNPCIWGYHINPSTREYER